MDFLLTWAFNDLPGKPAGITIFHIQPQARSSYCAGWCHLQPPGTAWTISVSLPLLKLRLPSWDIPSPQRRTFTTQTLWATGERVGCSAGGSHGQVAKGHPMAAQLCPHHVEVSLGVCLAKPEEHRWNLFPIHNKRRVKPAGISCTLSVMTNCSRCWCIC